MDVHPAKLEDLPELYANVHDSWPHAPLLRDHIQARLRSPQHQYAQWFLIRVGQQIASSLGVYPYRFRIHDKTVNAACIGAVHTHPEFRRQGLAARLLEGVTERLQSSGMEALLLYSDIAPAYYQKFGFAILPIHHGQLQAHANDALSTNCEPLPWNETSIQLIRPLYDAFQSQYDFSIERQDKHWQWLLRRFRQAKLAIIRNRDQSPIGYRIIAEFESQPHLIDWCWLAELDKAEPWTSLAQDWGGQSQSSLYLWSLPASAKFEPLTAYTPTSCIPMLKCFDQKLQQPHRVLLQPIDHV